MEGNTRVAHRRLGQRVREGYSRWYATEFVGETGELNLEELREKGKSPVSLPASLAGE